MYISIQHTRAATYTRAHTGAYGKQISCSHTFMFIVTSFATGRIRSNQKCPLQDGQVKNLTHNGPYSAFKRRRSDAYVM